MLYTRKFKKGFFASIAVLLHKIFPGTITAASIVNGAEELASTVNFGRAVWNDVKASGSDPAKIAEALAASVKKNIGMINPVFLTPENITEISSVCAEISGLPLEQIEAQIKLELGIK